MSVIIDRRLNDRNKSATNRERFIRRYKAHVQRAVTDMVAERSIRDMERGGQVKIPVKDIAEPSFRHGPGGDREYGTLDVGRSAEVSVMRMEAGPAELTDGYETIRVEEHLTPVGCLRAGEWTSSVLV